MTIDEPAALPLPRPTLTDAFAIGEALYDPTRMDDAVVSMLAFLGIGIYARDGAAIRTGNEHADGDPWLTEDEVWGLIDMGVADLLDASEAGPRYRLADLQKAVSRLLPQLSTDQLVAAYRDGYADHPNELAPQLLLGQPMDASTPLTRTQLWLLYMDGFVPLATTLTARMPDGALVAAGAGPQFGTASRLLPPILHDERLSGDEWQELRNHMLTIGFTIPFSLVPVDDLHEAHDDPGTVYFIDMIVRPGRPFISPTTGRTILAPNPGSRGGLAVTWESGDQSIWDKHGSFGDALPAQLLTNDGGETWVQYTPKHEVAEGQGLESSEFAPLTATADMVDLIRTAYLIDDESVDWLLSTGYIAQRRAAAGTGYQIGWHAPGIDVLIKDVHDVTLNVLPFGGEGSAHRAGQDTFSGTLLFDETDGTYRGTMRSTTIFDSQMTFTVPLAGDDCRDSTAATQELSVVGRVHPRSVAQTDVLKEGAFDGDDLLLSFYPTSSTLLNTQVGRCQSMIPYIGQGPSGQRMSGRFLPFLDSRITTPSTGYRIHLSKESKLDYQDWGQFEPASLIDSIFYVTVTRVDAP